MQSYAKPRRVTQCLGASLHESGKGLLQVQPGETGPKFPADIELLQLAGMLISKFGSSRFSKLSHFAQFLSLTDISVLIFHQNHLSTD